MAADGGWLRLLMTDCDWLRLEEWMRRYVDGDWWRLMAADDDWW
jgi:hypothetical protein